MWAVAACGVAWGCDSSKRDTGAPAGGTVVPAAAGAAGSDSSSGAGEEAGPPLDLPDAQTQTGPRCNGTAALCDKSYASVSFLGTHLSMASDASWPTQTQGRTLTDQLLVGGARVRELEIHADNGDLAVCEGVCKSDSESLPSVLREIAKFLQMNPTDVLTLLLRSTVPASQLVQAFDDQGLSAVAHSQTTSKAWPKLQQMIDAKHTLVVFVDQLPPDDTDGGADSGMPDPVPLPSWIHPLSVWAWETAPSEGTDCAIAHGNPMGALGILNHFVIGETAADGALIAAHAPEVVAARLARCGDDRRQVPNFVLVDFAEVGDPNGGVQIADGVR